jgi:DNA-binding response OmpR family regulator
MIKVLLALDDVGTRAFYAANLQTAGFRVVVTGSRDAVAAARRVGPQVIVVDASRPGADRQCAALKAQSDLPGVPVIALAGQKASRRLEQACDLILPVESLPDVLVDAIDRLVLNTRR